MSEHFGKVMFSAVVLGSITDHQFRDVIFEVLPAKNSGQGQLEIYMESLILGQFAVFKG